jgi:hypothetical protein
MAPLSFLGVRSNIGSLSREGCVRGFWDNEQPLPPAQARSAIALLSGLLAALAVASLIAAGVHLADGDYASAIVVSVGGLAVPFAIWLAIRILYDMLTLQHRAQDKLAEIAEDEVGPKPVAPRKVAEARAADDGVTYPDA